MEAEKTDKAAANKVVLAQGIAQQEGCIEYEDLATPKTGEKRPAPGEGDLFETPKSLMLPSSSVRTWKLGLHNKEEGKDL
jgi:hypothetical protein